MYSGNWVSIGARGYISVCNLFHDIEGDMIQFMFRNPHSFVHLVAPDDKGQVQRWAVEWAAAGQLNGIGRDTLKPGDHVIITGTPGRNTEDHRLRMRSILRPSDGWKWSGNFQ